jgi:predicted regulator of Ras-like GTPase activity (Roadblock/LC7/MglB family)
VKATVELLFNSVRNAVPEVRAVIFINAAGEAESMALPDFQFDAESFAAEYAALFRIAHRTAEDTAMGDAFEQILVSSKGILLARRFGSTDVAVFVCDPDLQLGRLRYEIRRLAEHSAVA